jgi:glutamate dehydrogenase (NAD(P)+)
LLELRDAYGEVDRSRLPSDVTALPRDAVIGVAADILVPAAISYAITPDNSFDVAAKVVIEAANTATTPDAEAMLTARGIPVIPDFVANAGAAAWAWWLLLGYIGSDPEDSFRKLRVEMRAKVSLLIKRWLTEGVAPRQTGWELGRARAEASAGGGSEVVIP